MDDIHSSALSIKVKKLISVCRISARQEANRFKGRKAPDNGGSRPENTHHIIRLILFFPTPVNAVHIQKGLRKEGADLPPPSGRGSMNEGHPHALCGFRQKKMAGKIIQGINNQIHPLNKRFGIILVHESGNNLNLYQRVD